MKNRFSLLALLVLLTGCLPYLYTPADTQQLTTHMGNVKREYLLHVPPSYSTAKAMPLVITIHGFSQWPSHQLWLSRWNKLADEKGVIVAYPSGTQFPKRWTMGGPSGYHYDPAPDVAFLRRMIAEISRDYRVDPSRVYVNGLSNGGGMTYILACELADEIAAVGVVSGGFIEPIGGCRPSRPMPVIAFHGTGDGIVPYGGNRWWPLPIEFPPILAWTQAWAERDGCAPAPVTATVSAHVQEMQYGSCRGGAEVVLYTIEGGGHAWPGGEELPQFIAGFTTHEIDATRMMWDFFSAHARPPAKPTTPRRTAVIARPDR